MAVKGSKQTFAAVQAKVRYTDIVALSGQILRSLFFGTGTETSRQTLAAVVSMYRSRSS